MAAATVGNFLYSAVTCQPAEDTLVAYGYTEYAGACQSRIVWGILVDQAFVPGLAGISESKNYLRSSVDDCTEKIKTMSAIFDTWTPAIECNIKEAPKLIQIGESGI